MSEIFTDTSGDKPFPAPKAGTLHIHSSNLPWRDSGTKGFWIKAFFECPFSRQRTWLMKVDPGAFAPFHAHAEREQIYVLEGVFYDQDDTYSAGEYIIRASDTAHTAGSKDGALVLLIGRKSVV